MYTDILFQKETILPTLVIFRIVMLDTLLCKVGGSKDRRKTKSVYTTLYKDIF